MGRPLTEEPLDRYVNRPLAAGLTRLLKPLPITPNQVTFLAALLGIASGVALAELTPGARLAGWALLWAAFVFDCADGQLARARGGGSPLGYLVDGAADYVIGVACHAGFIVLCWNDPAMESLGRPAAAALILATGVLGALHANYFEAVKFGYQATLGGNPAEHLQRQAAVAASLGERRGPWWAAVRACLAAYIKTQERAARTLGDRRITRGRFLTATLLGPTLRMSVLVLAAVAAAHVEGAIWIYPVFGAGIGSALYVGMRMAPAPARD